MKVEQGGKEINLVKEKNNDKNHVMYLIVICTLSLVMIAVIFVLLIGLFNEIVDNTKIFEILSPAFQTIVGAFVGIIGGRQMTKSSGD